MLLWAMAAFIKRKSRMHELMAAVPTAAQAAWRMNWRRVWSTENFVFSIKLSLDSEVGRHQQEMDDCLHTIPHLLVRGRRGVIKVAVDVGDDFISGGR